MIQTINNKNITNNDLEKLKNSFFENQKLYFTFVQLEKAPTSTLRKLADQADDPKMKALINIIIQYREEIGESYIKEVYNRNY